MNRTSRSSGRLSRLGAFALVAGVVASSFVLVPSSATAAAPAPDGLSAATAAASCWEVKQLQSSAPSGVYWLWTPALAAPEQFYCDQTTDGGGWVLIGRGREGWIGSNEGQGTTADVRDPVTGPAAFAPRQLSVDTITGLLGGARVDSLSEGVRLRRATNTAGTTWQEARFTFSSPRPEWTWQFAGVQRVGTWKIGSSSGSGTYTENIGSGSTQGRIDTRVDSTRRWDSGFAFGSGSRGTPAADSYVYAPTTSVGYPDPFTQVYLRPRVMSSSFAKVPDAGTAAVAKRAIAQSYPLATTWGVTGLGASGTGIQNTEVSAFAEVGGRVYVAGNFRYVQQNSSGSGQVEQSYLAAFDVATGQWVSTFRPTFDDQVKALAVLPGGKLAVGGAFLNANGASAPGFVVLNPTTGATDPSIDTKLINYISGRTPLVRSLDVQGNYLYIAGNFTHMTGGGSTTEIYTRMVGRVSALTGAPDRTWSPTLNGTVISIDASEQGDRLYAAGYFDQGPTALRAGAFRTNDAGSIVPWTVDFSNLDNGRLGYQQAVKEVGNRVWLGGSEHMLFSYARDTMAELSTNITIQGGDFQAISTNNGYIYAGCHCSQNVYEGARDWPSVGNAWTHQARIDQTGVWDAASGAYLGDFSPVFSTREGTGTWALFTDSTGVTWMGGDFTHARRQGLTANQWTGGFVRFATRDSVPPSTPANFAVSTAGGNDVLSWAASTDNRPGQLTYQVLRDDRVVATTTATSIQLPAGATGTKYFVRAADAGGNISASTVATQSGGTTPPPDPEPGTANLIAAGSSWSYYFGTTAPADGWQAADSGGSGWTAGAAPLGWGQSVLGTTLTQLSPNPLASYYRKAVQVADATKVASVTLTTRADDGIVVYVNGKEVGRSNMPTGTPTIGTYASSAIGAAAALSNPVTITVPGSAFTTGTNVIAAEVHSNYRSTPSHSFELTAVATLGQQPQPEPEPDPDPVATEYIAAGSSWTYYFGATAPASGWEQAGFATTDWSTGAAPLGWGQATLGTTFTQLSPNPLASYYRKVVTIPDPSKYSSVTVTTRADDGVVVYLNGTEIGRANMPAGTPTFGTYASSAIGAAAAVATPVTITVPVAQFVAGDNVIAAEVHSNYKSTPSHSFELTLVANP